MALWMGRPVPASQAMTVSPWLSMPMASTLPAAAMASRHVAQQFLRIVLDLAGLRIELRMFEARDGGELPASS